MTGQIVELILKIHAPDFDENELDEITQELEEELLELDVESVKRLAGDPSPEGSRVIDPVLLDTFVVNLTAGLGVPLVVSAWRWLKNKRQQFGGDDEVKIEIVSKKRKVVILSSDMSEDEVTDIAKSITTLVENSAQKDDQKEKH